MKTTSASRATDTIARRFILSAVALGMIGSFQLHGATDQAAEGKSHTLFMGVDISIEYENGYHRVRDVSGSSFVINAKGRPVFLPVNRASHKMKVENSLKLTRQSASVGNLVSGRSYTPRNDPRIQRMREMNNVTFALEEASAMAVDRAAAVANDTIPIYGGVEDTSGIGKAARDAEIDKRNGKFDAGVAAYSEVSAMVNFNLSNTAEFAAQATQRDLGLELFDAIEAEFDLSAETPLNNPYLLLVARFREPKAPPSAARNWIYAESLSPIGPTPGKIRIMQGGFPRGFILEDFQVRVYNRGEEVATNVSPKRVPLTREEAFEYVKIQYLSSNKEATLPATPAMGQLPADLHSKLSGGELARTYYVKVSKDGFADEAFVDEACVQKVENPYLESVVKSLRFKPALQKGKPVDGVASLQLAGLIL